MEDKIEITKEMFEECAISNPKLGITQTFENGDEFYEDENYIGWNGICVEKQDSDKWIKNKSEGGETSASPTSNEGI